MLRDRFLWLILLLSLVLKLALAIALDDVRPTNDENEYLYLAGVLVEKGRYAETFRPPLYPAYIALHLALGWGTLGVRVTQVLLSTLTILLVYRIAGRTLGQTAARVAVTLVAFDPGLVAFSHLLWTETLFILLLFVGLDLLTAELARQSRWPWLVAGLVFGLAGLTRPMILTFLPLLLPWAILQMRRHGASGVGSTPAAKRHVWLGGGVRFGLLVVGCAVAVSPWTIRNARATGAFILVDTNGAFNLLLGTRPVAAFVAKDDVWSPQFGRLGGQRFKRAVRRDAGEAQRLALRTALDNIRAHPGLFFRKSLWEAGHLWTLDSFLLRHLRNGWYGRDVPGWPVPALTVISVTLFIVLVLTALLGLAGQPPSPFRGIAILLVLHATLLHGLTIALSRHCLPLHAVLAIPAAGFLVGPRAALTRLLAGGWRSHRIYIVVLLLVGLGVAWLGDWELISDMLTTGGANHQFRIGLLPPVR
jgi:4-amino-4-deoxy-L-arabinose transferase-like glycosyltransferase